MISKKFKDIGITHRSISKIEEQIKKCIKIFKEVDDLEMDDIIYAALDDVDVTMISINVSYYYEVRSNVSSLKEIPYEEHNSILDELNGIINSINGRIVGDLKRIESEKLISKKYDMWNEYLLKRYERIKDILDDVSIKPVFYLRIENNEDLEYKSYPLWIYNRDFDENGFDDEGRTQDDRNYEIKKRELRNSNTLKTKEKIRSSIERYLRSYLNKALVVTDSSHGTSLRMKVHLPQVK